MDFTPIAKAAHYWRLRFFPHRLCGTISAHYHNGRYGFELTHVRMTSVPPEEVTNMNAERHDLDKNGLTRTQKRFTRMEMAKSLSTRPHKQALLREWSEIHKGKLFFGMSYADLDPQDRHWLAGYYAACSSRCFQYEA